MWFTFDVDTSICTLTTDCEPSSLDLFCRSCINGSDDCQEDLEM